MRSAAPISSRTSLRIRAKGFVVENLIALRAALLGVALLNRPGRETLRKLDLLDPRRPPPELDDLDL